MSRKLTHEYVKRCFEKEGCILVDKEYKGVMFKLKYIAKCGHENEISFNHFKSHKIGRLCFKCSMINKGEILKHSYKYVKEFFKKEGCKLIDKKYIGSITKIKYIAQCGHKNEITFDNFKHGKQGRFCIECAIKKKSKLLMTSFKKNKACFEKNGCKLISKEKDYDDQNSLLEYIAICGHKNKKKFKDFKSSGILVCKKCSVVRGNNHYKWNPNLTDKERSRRRCQFKSTLWRKEVYKRDDYICQITGKKSNGDLVAHHLKPYHKYKDLRFEVSNGITLNEKFHTFCHKMFGYKAEIGYPELIEAQDLWRKINV